MAPSRVIILGVALVTAIGAGYVAKRISTPPEPIVINNAPSEPAISLTEVLVLDSNVLMGGALEGHLAWQSWPSDTVGEGFITRTAEPDAIEELTGSVARMAMYQGEPLRRFKLVGEGQSFMSSILPAGKRAVAIEVAADTSAGGFILPNDFVDLIMTRAAQEEEGEGYITETILTNIRVLAIDQTIQEDEEGRRVRVGETATLELTPQQAEIITAAQQIAARLTLALRAVADIREDAGEEADYLISSRTKKQRGVVRMIKSGKISSEGTSQ